MLFLSLLVSFSVCLFFSFGFQTRRLYPALPASAGFDPGGAPVPAGLREPPNRPGCAPRMGLYLIFSLGDGHCCAHLFSEGLWRQLENRPVLSAAILVPAVFTFVFGLKGRMEPRFRSYGTARSAGHPCHRAVSPFRFSALITRRGKLPRRALELRRRKSRSSPTDSSTILSITTAGTGSPGNWMIRNRCACFRARTSQHFLVVTDKRSVPEIEASANFSITSLANKETSAFCAYPEGNRFIGLMRAALQNHPLPKNEDWQPYEDLHLTAIYRKVKPMVNLISGLSRAPTFSSPNSPSSCSSPTSRLKPPPVSVSPPRLCDSPNLYTSNAGPAPT